MAFRNVIVTERCKLEYSLNYLVCKKGLDEIKILIDEIKMVVIDSSQVSITTTLISVLSKKKIKVIFTDEKHNPCSEIIPYQNNYYSYRKIKEQIAINDETKGFIWKFIVERKIINQAVNLKNLGLMNEYSMLLDYSNNVTEGDLTNREGHAAKVYFNALFGTKFSREQDNDINKFLNYGYSILLSTINREVKMYGYLTEIGIHHIGESNPFNLSCDLIEPLRPLVDDYVIKKKVNNENYRIEFINMLAKEVFYDSKSYVLDNAIHLYVGSVIDTLVDKDESQIKFIEYEL